MTTHTPTQTLPASTATSITTSTGTSITTSTAPGVADSGPDAPRTTAPHDMVVGADHGAGDLDLDRVAVRFARHGAVSVAADLEVLARRARALGVEAASLDVMVDTSAPEVVRARAFSHVVRDHARALARVTADSFVAVA